MEYNDLFNLEPTVSFDTIINLSSQVLPPDKRRAPWLGLAHGVKLLENKDELAQYICAYGKMHKEKIYSALDSIQDITIFTEKDLTIIDWGCGQALATICFLDYMNKLGIRPSVNRIILIEPSECAIERAKLHLAKYIDSPRIVAITKYLNDVTVDDIKVSEGTTLHFFSNILDIPTVNINHLYNIINDGITSQQLFFCVGPQNLGAAKIGAFARLFDISEEDIINRQVGALSGRGTINMLVFILKGEEKKIVKVEFSRALNDGSPNPRILQNIVDNIVPSETFEKQVIQFYEAVIKYERKKSSDIGTPYSYPMDIDDSQGGVVFKIDIQSDPNFECEYKQNFNKAITRWPKNLYIGLPVSINNVQIKLLNFIYPQEDLRDFDYKIQSLTIPLYEFSLNRDELERLGISSAISDDIEAFIKEPNCTIDKLEQILKDAIANNLILDGNLILALSNEDVSLSQIQSELGKLQNLDQSPLLQSFLNGFIDENVVDDIDPETLLQVREMDESQRVAIATALNNKFSVITGPPGTGKTQMILNLVVNAITRGKRVLIASKNNKAIDNIKERYDSVEPERYMLRFGSRSTMLNSLLPYLNELRTRIPNLHFNETRYNQLFSDYKEACDKIHEAYGRLSSYVFLKDRLSVLERRKQDLLLQREKQEDEYNAQQNELTSNYSDIVPYTSDTGIEWSSYKNVYKKELNSLQTKVSGLRKLFFLLFQKNNYSERILNSVLSLPDAMSSFLEERTGVKCVADVKNADQLISLCSFAIEKIERIIYYRKQSQRYREQHYRVMTEIHNNENNILNEISDCRQKVMSIESQYNQITATIQQNKEHISQLGLDLLKNCVSKFLSSSNSTNAIARYTNYLPNSVPWQPNAFQTYVEHAQDFLNVCRLNAVTSLSAKNAFPLEKEIFDMVIIDEASQCDIASALPLIQRTKQLVVIGDPLQLRHIAIIKPDDELLIKNKLSIGQNPLVHYSEKSLWDYCNDLITSAKDNNRSVVLDSHYRCHPHVIGFSNEFFYRRLGINLKIKFIDKHPELKTKGVFWVDVKGTQTSSIINRNDSEVKKCIEIAEKLANLYTDINIGIISPFKHQAQEINSKLPQAYRSRIVADTVHKFQGDERDIIIYSLVVTDNSPDSKIRWIDSSVPNLVNVAVTRARSALIVVGNKDYIRKHSNPSLPLGYLVEYTTRQNLDDNIINGKTYIVDTNTLIAFPDAIERIGQSHLIVIPSQVVDKLEIIKTTSTAQEKQKAEQALRNIHRANIQGNVRIENADFHFLPKEFDRNNSENHIICVALRYRNQNPMLITTANSLIIKARSLMLETAPLSSI